MLTLAAVAFAAGLGLSTAAEAAKAPKATIIHGGKKITVSCNAMEAHSKHAKKKGDIVELRSIRNAVVRVCRLS